MSDRIQRNDRALTVAIGLMALAAFASGFSLRLTDPLLPQIALDFGVSIGAASAIVTAYAIPYGLTQAFAGSLGDRFGKCQAVAATCAISCVLVLLCALSQSLPQLTLARFVCAPAAACIVPLGMAYVGDVVAYEHRQTMLARFLMGQMLGMLSGQITAGIVGDHFGWRAVFFVLAAIFFGAAAALASQLRANPWTKPMRRSGDNTPNMLGEYRKLLSSSWSRFLLIAVFLEGGIFFGAFTYIAADLHARFDLSFSLIGVLVAALGLGSLLYAALVQHLVQALGERGLALGGGIVVSAGFVGLAIEPIWQTAPLAVGALGFGYYMLHNTLQTNATQMLPEARGTAVAGFSSALFLGQSAGVVVAALLFDRAGAIPVFVGAAALWLMVAVWIRRRLTRRLIEPGSLN